MTDFRDALAMIPEGYRLILQGEGQQWRARIIPPGYVNNWSPEQPKDAKAHSPEEAIRYAAEKCRPTACG